MHKTKDNQTFLIRKPTEDDAEKIIRYSRILFESTDQVLTMPEEYKISVEDEKTWINSSLHNPSALTLVADMDGAIVGLLFFIPQNKKKNRHTGEFGVSVHPDQQRKGIGRALIKTLLLWAKENSQIEKVFLNVFSTNANAIALYKDLGFLEEGCHIKAIKQPDGRYVDVVQMYVEVI